MVAERAHVARSHVDPLEQTLTRRDEHKHNRVDHRPCRRHLVPRFYELALALPALVRGVRDGRLADEPPAHLVAARRELLRVVPGVLVGTEQAALHAPAHVDERDPGVRDEHVRVAARAEGRLAERDDRERRLHLHAQRAEDLGDLGHPEEVAAHDAASDLMCLGLLDRLRGDDVLDDRAERELRRLDVDYETNQLSTRELDQAPDLQALREEVDEPSADARGLVAAREQEFLDLGLADAEVFSRGHENLHR